MSVPLGIWGHASRPTRPGLTACQMSTKGWPRTSTDSPHRSWTAHAMRVSFDPATMWSSKIPARAVSVGPNSSRTSSRLSAPSSNCTTIPASARSSPHTCCTSSASCLPSTQMREALATLGADLGAAMDPEFVTLRPPGVVRPARNPASAAAPSAREGPGDVRGRGASAMIGWPSSQNPPPSGKERRLPLRSSSSTRWTPPDFSTRVTAPTHPLPTSSRTMPISTWTCRDLGLGAPGASRCGSRASTSAP